jgi:hypothetical protein
MKHKALATWRRKGSVHEKTTSGKEKSWVHPETIGVDGRTCWIQ